MGSEMCIRDRLYPPLKYGEAYENIKSEAKVYIFDLSTLIRLKPCNSLPVIFNISHQLIIAFCLQTLLHSQAKVKELREMIIPLQDETDDLTKQGAHTNKETESLRDRVLDLNNDKTLKEQKLQEMRLKVKSKGEQV